LTWGDAARKVATWPKGKAAVHYDPAQPKISRLEPGGFSREDLSFVSAASAGLALGSKTAMDVAGHVWAKRRLPDPEVS